MTEITRKTTRLPNADQPTVIGRVLRLDDDLSHHVVIADRAVARQHAVLDDALRVVDDASAAVDRSRNDAGADRADEAADGMHAEHVERVVIAKRALHRGAEEEANRASNEAEDERAHGASIT